MQTNTENHPVVWLVGASEGIGLALTELLLQHSYRVIASARTATQNDALNRLLQKYSNQLKMLDCDVTQTDSLADIGEQAWQTFGKIDIWCYNVGSYSPMTLDEWQLDKFELMQQTNYLGAVHLMHHLLPKFRNQDHGRWIWNISLASDFGLPYGGGYSAPKAALMNLAESLQPELQEVDISLKVINHGFVKTRLTAKNDFNMLGLMEADEAAQRIFKALESNRFETRFPWNLSSVLATLKRLPKSWALSITKKMLHS